MKRMILMVLTLVIGFSLFAAHAQEVQSGPFEFGFQSGLNIPAQNRANVVGYGEGASVGYQLDPKLEVGLVTQHFSYSGPSGTSDDLRFLTQVRFTSPVEGKMRLFAFLDPGVNVGFYGSNSAAVNFDFEIGIGLRADITNNIHWFVSGADNFVYANSTNQDFPILVGVSFD